jgi:hypothetical protein
LHLNFLLQAATSNSFSSFEEVVRDAATLDAALGSQSGTSTPSTRTSPLLHLSLCVDISSCHPISSDFEFPRGSRLASLSLGSRSIAGQPASATVESVCCCSLVAPPFNISSQAAAATSRNCSLQQLPSSRWLSKWSKLALEKSLLATLTACIQATNGNKMLGAHKVLQRTHATRTSSSRKIFHLASLIKSSA